MLTGPKLISGRHPLATIDVPEPPIDGRSPLSTCQLIGNPDATGRRSLATTRLIGSVNAFGRRPLVQARLVGVSSLNGPTYGAGTATVTLTSGAAARALRRATGSANVTIATTGRARLLKRGKGAVALALAATGSGRRRRRVAGSTDVTTSATMTARDWFEQPKFDDLAAMADFNRDRYALPVTALADVPAASAAQLCVKRPATFAEWFAYTASSATPRTYFDGSLLRSDLATDLPRFDWINGKRQLALNGADTNLITSSAVLSGGFGGTVQSDVVIAPDGTMTADGFTEDSTTGEHYMTSRNVNITTGLDYTMSCFVKFNSTTRSFRLRKAVGSEFNAMVNPVTKVITSISSPYKAAGLIAYPNDWYRFWMTFTAEASLSPAVFRLQYSNGSYAGDGVQSHYAWGFQLTQTSFLTPYIPTGASAVSRAIETARLSPTIEAILQRTAASVVVRGQNLLRGSGRIIGTQSGSSLGQILRASGNLTAINMGGTTIEIGSANATLLSGVPWAGAAAFSDAAPGRSLKRDIGTLSTDGETAPASRANIFLGRDATGNVGDGWYDFVGIAPSRVSDARLTALAVAA